MAAPLLFAEPEGRGHAPGEDGYMLLAMVVMAALILIALAVAAPVVAHELRRDKEVESEHRAEQYVRAIQLYYRKNKSYPPSIKALEDTNNVRFLRQQYVDPLTGQANWRLIHLGEQKTTIKSFFGQELGGIASGGLGSAAGMASAIGGGQSTSATGTSGASGTASTTVSSTNALNAGFGGSTIGGSAGSTGATGTGLSSSSDSSSTGGAIVGVGTAKTGTSILQPNGQTTYETWEFWYDPRIELLRRNVNILGGGIMSGAATGLGGSSTGSSGTSSPGTSTSGTSPGSGVTIGTTSPNP